jgi:hypothetical protein
MLLWILRGACRHAFLSLRFPPYGSLLHAASNQANQAVPVTLDTGFWYCIAVNCMSVTQEQASCKRFNLSFHQSLVGWDNKHCTCAFSSTAEQHAEAQYDRRAEGSKIRAARSTT